MALISQLASFLFDLMSWQGFEFDSPKYLDGQCEALVKAIYMGAHRNANFECAVVIDYGNT